MPRFLSPPRRVSGSQSPRPPVSHSPAPAPISREDTVTELRAIYRLLDSNQIPAAKQRLITLGKNLQN